MSKTVFLTVLFAFALMVIPAAAQDVRVTTSFDKRSVDVDGEINMTIKIVGAKTTVQRPQLPQMDSFDSYYTGRASHFSFINGEQKSTVDFNYVLIPKRAGKFIVPPIEAVVDGKIFRTSPIEIEVLASEGRAYRASSSPGTGPARQSQYIQQTQPTGAQQPYSPPVASGFVPDGSDEDIFIRATVDKKNVYVGEQIFMNYTLYTRMDTRLEGFVEEPETSGFWVEEFPLPQETQEEMANVGGLQYLKAEFKKVALFPTSPGSHEIYPGTVRCTVPERQQSRSIFDEFFSDSFFGGSGFFSRRITKNLRAKPVTINVKSLPESGKPDNFSGIVGDYKLSTNIDKKVVAQGEPVKMTFVIEGEGNIETLQKPEIPELQNFKVYNADTSTQMFKSLNRIRGRKTFEVIFIPQMAGDTAIPSLDFNFFNPKTESYVNLRTPTYNIKVKPGKPQDIRVPDLPEIIAPSKKAIKREELDIHFIKDRLPDINKYFLVRKISLGLAGVSGLLIFIFLILIAVRKREMALLSDTALRRRVHASRNFKRRLHKLQAMLRKPDKYSSSEICEKAADCMNYYLSDKLNLSAQGLTTTMISENLTSRGVKEETIGKIRDFLDKCDLVRFTSAEMTKNDFKNILSVLREVHKVLEKRVK